MTAQANYLALYGGDEEIDTMPKPQPERRCTKCHRLRPRQDFPPRPNQTRPNALSKRCSDCVSAIDTAVLPDEEWRAVVGWEGLYEVSNLARVRRVAGGVGASPGRVLRPHPIYSGYLHVSLTRANRSKLLYVHVLVARAFLGPCPPGHEVNHCDSNRANCVLTNLEYLTHVENMQHATTVGLMAKGERHVRARLNESAVREIRRSSRSNAQLAQTYGVSAGVVSAVRCGRSWKHVQD